MKVEQSPEIQSFWRFIESSIDRLVACLDGLNEDELNWRPLSDANSLFVLATHILGTAEENILGVLCGQQVDRQRQAEFATRGGSAEPIRLRWNELRERMSQGLVRLSPAKLDDEREHPRRGRQTGREVLIVVARHAAEHLGHAELTLDLLRDERRREKRGG